MILDSWTHKDIYTINEHLTLLKKRVQKGD